jgi:hypothetical protein
MAYVRFKKGGWGFMTFICVLTIAMYLGAYWVHKQTYRSPRDPTTLGSINPPVHARP